MTMIRRKPRWNAMMGAASFVPVLVAAGATTSSAQTWSWKYVTRTANTPPLAAQSTVTLGNDLRTTYTVPVGNRQVVIESCRAGLHDIERASMVRTLGRSFLLVQLDPSRPAACASGARSAIALPTDNEAYVNGVIGAVNSACCSKLAQTGAAAQSRPASSAAPSSAPSPAPSASAAPANVPATSDGIESDGPMARIRVQNTGSQAVRIRDVAVFDCRAVASGCGTAPHDVIIAPHAAATIATVTGAAGTPATFRYRYTAVHGDARVAHAGASTVAAAPLATPESDAGGTIVPAHLIKRGSSRLAIGETGTALVRLVIAGNGTPTEATIVSISNRRLSAAAIETAVSSTYAPATRNGKPIEAKYVATFSFDGEDPALSSIPVWKRSPIPAASAAPVDPAASVPPAATSPVPVAAPAPVPAAAPTAVPSAAPSSAPVAVPAPLLGAPPTPPMLEPTPTPAAPSPGAAVTPAPLPGASPTAPAAAPGPGTAPAPAVSPATQPSARPGRR